MLFTDYSLPSGLPSGLPVLLHKLLPVLFLPVGKGEEKRSDLWLPAGKAETGRSPP